MKKVVLFLLLIGSNSILNAQNFISAYTDQSGSSYLGSQNRIISDSFDNTINSTTFSNNSLTVGNQTFAPQGPLNSVIIKRDVNGALLWARGLVCGGTVVVGDLAVDQSDNLYITGFFGDSTSSTTLQLGPNSISSGPGTNTFVLKYSPSGQLLWATSFLNGTSGSSGNADLYQMTTNGTNRIVVSAPFKNVGAQTIGSSTVNTSDGNLVLASLDENGNWLNAYVFSGVTNSHQNISLSMNSQSDLYVSGIFQGSMNFGSAGTLTTPPSQSHDYVLKTSLNWNIDWAIMLNSNSWWRAEVIALNNGCYLAGSFFNSITLGGTTLTSNYTSTYLTQLDASGNFLWAKKYGDNSTTLYCATMKNNSIFMCGSTENIGGSNVFDNLNLVFSQSLANPTGSISYLIKTDLSGNALQGVCYRFNFPTINTMDISASSARVSLTGNAMNGATFGGYTINPPQTNGSNYVAHYTDSANMIQGASFYDFNANNVFDSGDLPCESGISIQSALGTSNTIISGNYLIGVGAGTIVTTLNQVPQYYTVNQTSYQSNFSGLANQVDSNFNFIFQPIPNQSDLVIDLVTQAFRPGFTNHAWVTLKNIGTTSESATMLVELAHPMISILSTMPAGGVINGNQVEFSYSLNPATQVTYMITYETDVLAQLGNTFNCTASAINAQDVSPADNIVVLDRMITGSYDPNDKLVFPEGIITPTQVQNGDYLYYTIRFQNTGNDTAFTVIIRDTLSHYLDLSSFQMLSSSHPVVVDMNNQLVTFRYNNILLPDSTTNEPASHGFAKFRIKPNNLAVLGSVIENTAYIYFDFNDPIITNTTQTPVNLPTFDKKIENNPSLQVYPNPSDNSIFNFANTEIIQSIRIFDAMGRLIHQANPERKNVRLDLNGFANGVYHYELMDEQSTFRGKLLIMSR
jgi:uncharacterized repeat protein (TIGR01451 family)